MSKALVVHARNEATSYREILRSSALIGGSSALNVAVGIVRTKAMAMLLGPAGFGLLGTYALIVELARSVAQLGIHSSGVRQIAEATASADEERIARTAKVLRRAAVGCAAFGALLLIALAGPVSTFSFKTDEHRAGVALLSVAVFVAVIASGQGALLQGMRRVADLAKANVLGSVLGTLGSIGVVVWLGQEAIAASLIVVAGATLIATWWYSRKVRFPTVVLSLSQTLGESRVLFQLGLAFMMSGLLTIGAAYVVRVFVVHRTGLEGAGFYNAAWTLGGLYVGFVLQALGADFYPRLVGAAADDETCNRLVNEQAHVSLLLALPGVLATLTLAPLLLSLFYSAAFAEAAQTLRWICLGMALRVFTWPIGYIVVAKNRQRLFVVVESAWAIVNVGLSWLCIGAFGVVGAGLAFFGSYAFHAAVVYPVARHLTGFRWTPVNRRTGLLVLSTIALVFIGFESLPPAGALSLGAAMTLASTLIAVRTLKRLVRPVPRPSQASAETSPRAPDATAVIRSSTTAA